MKARLMHVDRDLDLGAEPPANADDLVQDLELGAILDAMAAGDDFLRDVAAVALLDGLTDPDAVLYRQAALRDCLRRPEVVRELYDLAVEALETRRKTLLLWSGGPPGAELNASRRMLELLSDVLGRLRAIADASRETFVSPAFSTLFSTLARELDDAYLRRLETHLRRLRFADGVLISAGLGRGNRGADSVLRKAPELGLLERLRARRGPSHSFSVPARDEGGIQALGTIADRGVQHVAAALAESTDHVLGFFRSLRAELGFFVGCLNLRDRLEEQGRPICFPTPVAAGESAFSARELYDVSLGFHLHEPVVGSSVEADGKELVLVTGANQGGKSTFLRSVGQAQLMLQAGMFVGADALRASVCAGVFTHSKREEDASMERGKLEEELARMSAIADEIEPRCLLLCNESFASTNEREGSEIARQVTSALVENDVRVFFVTHLFDFAESLHAQGLAATLFLRAERLPDGRRTFRMVEGEPLPTSFGADSYRRIFAVPAGRRP